MFLSAKPYVLAVAGAVAPAASAGYLLPGGSADGAAAPDSAASPIQPATTAVTPATPVVGPTIYVAPAGSDAHAGSRTAPLRTAQAALTRLPAAGGTIQLAAGSYRGQRLVIDHRSNIRVLGTGAVFDEAGLTPPDGLSGVIEIRASNNISVTGLDVRNYRTSSLTAAPVGIYVSGRGNTITLAGNHVHHLGNDNTSPGNDEIDAHGIAVYGTDPQRSISNLTITGNEVDHLVLGASEAVVVNGNVDGWAITKNRVHDNNNIGIDAIGYEQTIDGPARYTEVNRARHGVISQNTVTGISSVGNPAYWQDGGYCHCADGIYVDGGTDISMSQNLSRNNDIGLEVAAEDPHGKTNAIRVTGNTVTGSHFVGLTIGGYGPGRGEAYDVTVTGNTFTGNNTLHDGSPEVLLQYKVHDSTISGNRITSTNADDPELLQRVAAAGTTAQNAGVVIDRNSYSAPADAEDAAFSWFGRPVSGWAGWRQLSGQDRHSTYRAR